jgi:Fe-Mn family superoxide dismutase
MYEHSYHLDYGAKAAAYVDAVMNNLNLDAAGRKLAALQGA